MERIEPSELEDIPVDDHDSTLGILLERFYLSLTGSKPEEIIEAYVNLEGYCPNVEQGESWEVQDEIVKDARRKCVSLIRAPYVDKTNQLNIAARKRLKQRTALSDNPDGSAVAHGQRYMFIMMDVMGTWSNWLVELRGYGFRREMITQIMNNLYPRIIEIVWDAFQSFKQDKDLEKLCAKSTDINTELHLNTLDNTLQQLATMRSLINKHYTFQYDLFTPYFLIEYDSEEALMQVPLLERLVLVSQEELQKWKELDFFYAALESAYLLRSITVACEEEEELLEVESGVFILHMVEDVLFLMNKAMDRALLTAEESTVFALGNKILELVYFGNHGGMQDALLYEVVSTSLLYRRCARRRRRSGRATRRLLQSILHKCTGKSYHTPATATATATATIAHAASTNELEKSFAVNASSFQTPAKSASSRNLHSSHVSPSQQQQQQQQHQPATNATTVSTTNSGSPHPHPHPSSSSPRTPSAAMSTPNGNSGISGHNGSSSEALDSLWKGANSWLTTLASPYIARTDATEAYETSNNNSSSSSPAHSPSVAGSPSPLSPKGRSGTNSNNSNSSSNNIAATEATAAAATLEELVLKALQVDEEDEDEKRGGDNEDDEDDGEEDGHGHGAYDPMYNPDDPALLSASATASAAATATATAAVTAVSAASAVGVTGGFLLLSATQSLVSAFLSDGDHHHHNDLATNTTSATASATSTNSSGSGSGGGGGITTEQADIARSFERFLCQVFELHHAHYHYRDQPLSLPLSTPTLQDEETQQQQYLAGRMPMSSLPLLLLLQDADLVVQLNTMAILTQGIRNLQEALAYAAAHAEDMFLARRSHRLNTTAAAVAGSNSSSSNNSSSNSSTLQVLLHEYHACIQLYREYVLAEIRGLVVRQFVRHVPTLAAASQGLFLQQQRQGGGGGGGGGAGGDLYGLVGQWLLGSNSNNNHQQNVFLRRRNEQLLQATSLFLQSNFEVSGAEMEQRWSLQLLRSFTNHFLHDLAPVGPSFTAKLQDAHELLRNGESAKFTLGGLAMSFFTASSSSSSAAAAAAASGPEGPADSPQIYQSSDFCYVLARQYVLCFVQLLIRILYEQCLSQRVFNEWGALLFQEEVRSFARFVEAIFEDNSIASLSMNEENNNEGGDLSNEDDEEGLLSWKATKKQLQRLLLGVKLLSLDAPADIIRYTFIRPVVKDSQSVSASMDRGLLTSDPALAAATIAAETLEQRQQKDASFSGMKRTTSGSGSGSAHGMTSKGPAGAVEMSEDEIRAILSRRSDFSKEVVQKVKINFAG